jgi:hypothetical protein
MAPGIKKKHTGTGTGTGTSQNNTGTEACDLYPCPNDCAFIICCLNNKNVNTNTE